MKRRTLIILAILVPLLAAGGWAAKKKLSAPKEEGPKPVAVTRGELTDKAMAIGTIEPRVEVGVKSILAGVVRKRYAEVGDYVKKGAPLLEISPNPTPLELIELRRSIEMRQIELKNLQKELERQTELKKQNLNSDADVELAQRRVDESTVQLSLSQERLALQENGKIVGGDNAVETVIRSPIDGFVLEDSIEIGDPVVPLTPYQEGTVLMRMAAMKDLIFRGTVDEIDVGRLTEGMPVVIKIGALPDAQVAGKLSKIWLKARKQEQATVFPIEIQLVMPAETLLGQGSEPALAPGYGAIPAAFARALVVSCGSAGAAAWVRRLFTTPDGRDLVTMDSRRRRFSGPLRHLIELRDQTCRTPWCDAPIRHGDHVVPERRGGATSAANGQGLCEACNYAKEAPGWQCTTLRGGPSPAKPHGPPHTVRTTTPTRHAYDSTAPPVLPTRVAAGPPAAASALEHHLVQLLVA